MSALGISICFGIGVFFTCISLSYFHWKMVKRNKSKAIIRRRVEELHKACVS
jgi:hypothetical protein